MGLTAASTGAGAVEGTWVLRRESPEDRVVALAGNPNVGKSTLFNGLTHLRQHTGNWPGKTVAASCCDELSKAAQLTGAINTIVNEDGKLVGHITDGTGWIRNCLEHGFDIHGKKLIIAGTGGAGTAIQIAAALGGAKKIVILARKSSPRFANGEETVRKIREHVPECQAEIFDLEDAEVLRRELADADLFCNATKVGMKPMDDQSVIPDVSMLRPELVVSDIVYNPRETKLLKDAKKAGCKVIPGIGMLLWQGAEAFRLYTGQEMPVKEVQERYFSE